MRRLSCISGGILALLLGQAALAQEPCAPVVGTVESIEGVVEVERAGTFVWQMVSLGETLCQADAVRVGARGRAALRLVNDAVLRLDQNTTLQLTDVQVAPQERSFLQLIAGVLQSFSRSPRQLAINTPYLNATIEGTEFVIAAADETGRITVFEGVVAASNELGEVRLASGEEAVAVAGQAPVKRIVVRPRDAVQWALYYPPIFAALGGQDDAAELPPALAAAMARADAGDLEGAFALLDEVPESARDVEYQVYRAALLLSVGRVDEAEQAIERALARDPDAGLAYAQRAIIELVRNEDEAALASAERAVELNPTAAAPRIALSYAQQARFQLEAARDTLRQAVEAQPRDALAWARLSELWLMLGDRQRAREAADRAVALAPEVSRAQITRGFANLVEFRTQAAKAAFERAIELAPADPLPRLGLGLAQIREGDLEEGRANLEVAVGLDANDALLRAYLGKAYYEEKRDDLANQQFHMAQELDPLDPTAYLYEAIKQQTENRPVEALKNLEKSIALNDNRAVYRSRLLLDADQAARGTSLALIYDDLGFEQLGEQEAVNSLTLDPTTAAAHRFLSDIYLGVRRRESARVSELLQAQMLQDLNVNPVQPSLSATNLNIVTQGGPADAGFNEYTPLFERRQTQVDATGLVGNDDTYGGEGVVSMLYDRYSVSAGAFHYRTDGWRNNGDIKHDIQNVFFQTAITPEINAQFEVNHRETKNGDLEFNFDPDDFSSSFERNLDQTSGRVGLRYSPTVSSDLLFSGIYTDRKDQQSLSEGFSDFDGEVHDKGYQVESQHLFRQPQFNTTAGISYSKFDNTIDTTVTSPFFAFDNTLHTEATHTHPYAYANINVPAPVTWTVGLAYDDFEQENIQVEKLSGKFGAQWQITEDLELRGVLLSTVKPLLANNRSLEPTQVAGFNQLFDESNGTKSRLYGVGLDWNPTSTLAIGHESTWRDITVPFALADQKINQNEETHRLYAYWAPLDQIALSAELVYDRFNSERSGLTLLGPVPEEVDTLSIPLGLRYFHPSGFFAGVTGTFVNQQVDRTPGQVDDLQDGDDSFYIVDAAIGYRLPKRFGVISLQVSNIFDEGFRYQDDSYREFENEASTGPYIPERQILARVTLNW